jgi:hypothetical protein
VLGRFAEIQDNISPQKKKKNDNQISFPISSKNSASVPDSTLYLICLPQLVLHGMHPTKAALYLAKLAFEVYIPSDPCGTTVIYLKQNLLYLHTVLVEFIIKEWEYVENICKLSKIKILGEGGYLVVSTQGYNLEIRYQLTIVKNEKYTYSINRLYHAW